MDKESIYLLQKIDCNCNDCKFMERDFEAYKKWEQWHREQDLRKFEMDKAKAITSAKGIEDEKGRAAQLRIAEKMTFQFELKSGLQYGKCLKFTKPVAFIPMTCQIDTQECFVHRKDYILVKPNTNE